MTLLQELQAIIQAKSTKSEGQLLTTSLSAHRPPALIPRRLSTIADSICDTDEQFDALGAVRQGK